MATDLSKKYSDDLFNHIRLLHTNLYQLTGKKLVVDAVNNSDDARKIHESDVAVLSHGSQKDPIFNYANQTTLDLFEMTWSEFIKLPSRQSAEPVNRMERADLLNQVNQYGYIDDYSGIRISSSGQRFRIQNAIVWNLYNDCHRYQGQAAMFSSWTYL